MGNAGRSQRSPPAHPSPWQEAQADVLGVVFHRVNSLPDNARFATVCRAWRHAVANLLPPLPPPLAWLLLPDFKLSRLSHDGASATGHRLRLPEGLVVVPECVGSTCDGRVILLKVKEQSCFSMNPLTGATTTLPEFDLQAPRKELPYAIVSNHGSNSFRPSMPRKVVTSGAPNRGSACIMAGISGFGPSATIEPLVNVLRPPGETSDADAAALFLCRPGDATWSVTTDVRLGTLSDIVFHDGRLYFFNWKSDRKLPPSLHAFDIGEDGDGTLRVTRVQRLPGPIFRGHNPHSAIFFYLVESRGRLLVVQRECTGRRTHTVTVLALDMMRPCPYKWETVRSLDGEIVFLGPTSSLSVPASQYDGARGDRIYFSQEMFVSANDCPRQNYCRHQHCEVFDVSTGTSEMLCMGMAPGPDFWCWCPTWFVPSQQKYPDAN